MNNQIIRQISNKSHWHLLHMLNHVRSKRQWQDAGHVAVTIGDGQPLMLNSVLEYHGPYTACGDLSEAFLSASWVNKVWWTKSCSSSSSVTTLSWTGLSWILGKLGARWEYCLERSILPELTITTAKRLRIGAMMQKNLYGPEIKLLSGTAHLWHCICLAWII